MNASVLPIAVFLSGSGRTLANLLKHRDERELAIDIRLVISSRSDVRGVEIARSAGIETLVVRKHEF
ncbi:MAG: phosphoribosylglycinamide formyltransferase, partial [Planctomycetota bacterium]